ncbi:MAG: hypothetical protein M3Z96_12790 [Pseudomonadota bacterium]|nr:hypothetical protein [Pseudomonadota bacterium]
MPEAHRSPEARSDPAAQSWRRDACGDWPQLQCEWLDDFEVGKMIGTTKLNTLGTVYLLIVLLFFAIMPTSVFLQIASDIIQVSAIFLPFAIAFMIMLVSTDISFGLPVVDNDVAERLSKRREDMRDKLIAAIKFNVALILFTILGKAFCAWFVDKGWFATILNHIVVFTVGGLIVVCVIRLGEIINIFGYLSTGADLGFRVRQHSQHESKNREADQ